jgi:hypothetical protein
LLELQAYSLSELVDFDVISTHTILPLQTKLYAALQAAIQPCHRVFVLAFDLCPAIGIGDEVKDVGLVSAFRRCQSVQKL